MGLGGLAWAGLVFVSAIKKTTKKVQNVVDFYIRVPAAWND